MNAQRNIPGALLCVGCTVRLKDEPPRREPFVIEWIMDDSPEPEHCTTCITRGNGATRTWARLDHLEAC